MRLDVLDKELFKQDKNGNCIFYPHLFVAKGYIVPHHLVSQARKIIWFPYFWGFMSMVIFVGSLSLIFREFHLLFVATGILTLIAINSISVRRFVKPLEPVQETLPYRLNNELSNILGVVPLCVMLLILMCAYGLLLYTDFLLINAFDNRLGLVLLVILVIDIIFVGRLLLKKCLKRHST